MERAANDLHFSQKLSKKNFFGGAMKSGVFEGQKYKIELFTPRAESPEGYYYHDCGRGSGRAAGRPGVRDVSCDTFFHSNF